MYVINIMLSLCLSSRFHHLFQMGGWVWATALYIKNLHRVYLSCSGYLASRRGGFLHVLSIRSKLERGGEKDSYICSPSGLSGKFEFYETKGMGHVFLSKHGSDNALNELAVVVDFVRRCWRWFSCSARGEWFRTKDTHRHQFTISILMARLRTQKENETLVWQSTPDSEFLMCIQDLRLA